MTINNDNINLVENFDAQNEHLGSFDVYLRAKTQLHL